MDTQNTPVHVKLWHREFWWMAIANLLLMMSAYMLVPALPPYLQGEGYDALHVAGVMGIYGVGVFALGGFCSYLVQRYRRNHVCQHAILGVVLSIALLYYLEFVLNVKLEYWMVFCARFLQGAFLGLAQMTLSSTLVIDTCESFLRTEANHTAAWFSRFALSLGPVVSLLVGHWFGYGWVLVSACGLALAAWVLIAMVKFPFKAPSDTMKVYSLDRFFLPQGTLLFFNLAMIAAAVGLLFSQVQTETFYAMLLVGFFLALLAERYAFANADLKSEVVSGLIMMAAGVLILHTRHATAVTYVAPSLIGFGIGAVGSRFLLFFIKLAKHCQRGTSQSSFFLAWELGLSLGLFAGVMEHGRILALCLCQLAASLFLYIVLVHPWYVRHKNR